MVRGAGLACLRTTELVGAKVASRACRGSRAGYATAKAGLAELAIEAASGSKSTGRASSTGATVSCDCDRAECGGGALLTGAIAIVERARRAHAVVSARLVFAFVTWWALHFVCHSDIGKVSGRCRRRRRSGRGSILASRRDLAVHHSIRRVVSWWARHLLLPLRRRAGHASWAVDAGGAILVWNRACAAEGGRSASTGRTRRTARAIGGSSTGHSAASARLWSFASVATHGACRADGTRGRSRGAVVASIAHHRHSVDRGAFEPGRAGVAMELSRQAVATRGGARGFALLVGALVTRRTVDAGAHAVCRVLAVGAGRREVGPIAGGASWAAGAGHRAGVEGVVPGCASLRRLVFVGTS